MQVIYNDPSGGNSTTSDVTFALVYAAVPGQAESHWYVQASTSGEESVYLDINDKVLDLIHASISRIPDGIYETVVTSEFTAEGDTLTVEDTTGFTANVPIMVRNLDGSTTYYATPTAIPGSTSFTLPTANEGRLNADIRPGALVRQAYWGASGLLLNNEVGPLERKARPDAPTSVTPEDGGSQEIATTATAPASNADTIEAYDLYVTNNQIDAENIPRNIYPAVADITDIDSIGNASQYFDTSAGGMKDITAGTYYVYMVAKTATGQRGAIVRSTLSTEASVVVA